MNVCVTVFTARKHEYLKCPAMRGRPKSFFHFQTGHSSLRLRGEPLVSAYISMDRPPSKGHGGSGVGRNALHLGGLFWKTICLFISFCWTWIVRNLRSETPPLRVDLRFVPDSSRFFLFVTKRDDEKPNAQMCTDWSVTNASISGISARLLRARLVKPRLRQAITRDRVFTIRCLEDQNNSAYPIHTRGHSAH